MTLRNAAKRHDRILIDRLDRLVPDLMRRAGIDAWVLVAREYNEDPVLATMLPATWLGTARRRTVLAFLDRGDRVERMAVARYAVGNAFPAVWDPEEEPDQWGCLARILDETDPRAIGLGRDPTFALADGLTATEHDALLAALPERLRARVVPATAAAIGWLETRLPEERELMAEACAVAHGFLGRALSAEVIEPGRTTTADVEWWLRDTVAAAGLTVWFQPTVAIQRQDAGLRESFSAPPGEVEILQGDLVHIDFGITYHGYCTDQQQHAYVLRPGESEAPRGLREGLAAANRLQDLLLEQITAERTGNEVLAATRQAAQAEGIDGLIYTHPIGFHGHAAGPTIGLWDQQAGVPGQGDYPVWPNTAYSIELQARVPVAEWGGRIVQFMLEEEAFFDGDTGVWLDGRQTELHLI